MSEAKRLLTQSWLAKARNDLVAAEQLSTFEQPRLDVAIYHCQQAAEKAVKGFLVFHDCEYPRNHDIGALLTLAERYEPRLGEWRIAGSQLTPYATLYRYPADPLNLLPDTQEFDQALQLARRLYEFVLSLLPDVHPST